VLAKLKILKFLKLQLNKISGSFTVKSTNVNNIWKLFGGYIDSLEVLCWCILYAGRPKSPEGVKV
jgi:hypothetical protein